MVKVDCKMHLLRASIVFIAAFLTYTTAFASEPPTPSLESQESSVNNIPSSQVDVILKLDEIIFPQTTNNELAKQTVLNVELKNLLLEQNSALKAEIEHLKSVQNDDSGFEVWSGLLLATSALILGAVGIGIAILSFFGYQELINKGVEEATKVASEVAKQVVLENLSSEIAAKSKEEIEHLIESGQFYSIANEIVQKIIYRGVLSGNDVEDDSNGDAVEE